MGQVRLSIPVIGGITVILSEEEVQQCKAAIAKRTKLVRDAVTSTKEATVTYVKDVRFVAVIKATPYLTKVNQYFANVLDKG